MFNTIRSKLAACFGAFAALLLVTSTFSYLEMKDVHEQFEELVTGDAFRSKLSKDRKSTRLNSSHT